MPTPEHLKCVENGILKPVYSENDFSSEQAFYRSFPHQDAQGTYFPGVLVKIGTTSVNWSRLALAEDCWHYKPSQGVGKFNCLAPEISLRETMDEPEIGQMPAVFHLEHAPVPDDSSEGPENYSHCHICLCYDNLPVQDNPELMKKISTPTKKVFRQLLGRKIVYRRNYADPWTSLPTP